MLFFLLFLYLPRAFLVSASCIFYTTQFFFYLTCSRFYSISQLSFSSSIANLSLIFFRLSHVFPWQSLFLSAILSPFYILFFYFSIFLSLSSTFRPGSYMLSLSISFLLPARSCSSLTFLPLSFGNSDAVSRHLETFEYLKETLFSACFHGQRH